MDPLSLIRRALARCFLSVTRASVSFTDDAARSIRSGGVIVCANHVSFLDGILIAMASPAPMVYAVDRDYSVCRASTSAGLRFLSWLGYGEVVPISQDAPHSIRTLAKLLRSGHTVMIFPEGGISRDGKMMPLRQGLEWLKRRTGAACVWVRISGAENSKLFARSGKQLWPSISIDFGVQPWNELNSTSCSRGLSAA